MRWIRLIVFSLGLLAPAALFGMALEAQATLEGTGLPLPRFVSLRADEVNMRAGPGIQYPIEWVYHHQNLPVEVISEYQTWRKIRDWEGSQGWVHQSMLAGRRTVIVTGKTRTLREGPDAKSPPQARLEKGAVGSLIECPGTTTGWCKVRFDDHAGWLRRVDFWGVHSVEVLR